MPLVGGGGSARLGSNYKKCRLGPIPFSRGPLLVGQWEGLGRQSRSCIPCASSSQAAVKGLLPFRPIHRQVRGC